MLLDARNLNFCFLSRNDMRKETVYHRGGIKLAFSFFLSFFFFLRCAEPVANKKKIEKRDWIADGRNVLSKMQRTFGPLGMLHEYMENRTRIKVGHDS